MNTDIKNHSYHVFWKNGESYRVHSNLEPKKWLKKNANVNGGLKLVYHKTTLDWERVFPINISKPSKNRG